VCIFDDFLKLLEVRRCDGAAEGCCYLPRLGFRAAALKSDCDGFQAADEARLCESVVGGCEVVLPGPSVAVDGKDYCKAALHAGDPLVVVDAELAPEPAG